MAIFIKIVATMLFIFGIIWLSLPGGFGVLHFNEGRTKLVATAVNILWGLLILVHFIAIYRTWFSGDNVYVWVLALFLGQVLFFSTIATDVSTR